MIVRGIAWILTTMPSMPLIDSDSFILLTMWTCWRLQDKISRLVTWGQSRHTKRTRSCTSRQHVFFTKNRGILHEQVIIRRPWMECIFKFNRNFHRAMLDHRMVLLIYDTKSRIFDSWTWVFHTWFPNCQRCWVLKQADRGSYGRWDSSCRRMWWVSGHQHRGWEGFFGNCFGVGILDFDIGYHPVLISGWFFEAFACLASCENSPKYISPYLTHPLSVSHLLGQLLGIIIHKKYGEDLYIIDKFPKAGCFWLTETKVVAINNLQPPKFTSKLPWIHCCIALTLVEITWTNRCLPQLAQEVRPFYTMPDPTDEKWTNAYDAGKPWGLACWLRWIPGKCNKTTSEYEPTMKFDSIGDKQKLKPTF